MTVYCERSLTDMHGRGASAMSCSTMQSKHAMAKKNSGGIMPASWMYDSYGCLDCYEDPGDTPALCPVLWHQ
jgi:hypothetical protein